MWVLRCTGYDEEFQRKLSTFNNAPVPPQNDEDRRQPAANRALINDYDDMFSLSASDVEPIIPIGRSLRKRGDISKVMSSDSEFELSE